MMIRKVKIKGKIRKLIKENGIWVYLKHRCKHCKKRTPWNKWHEYNGIPDFINGHQQKGKFNSNYGKPRPKELKDRQSKRMSGKRNSMYGKRRHHTKETIEKIRIANTGENNGFFGKTHSPEAINKMSKSAKEDCQKRPERMKNARKSVKQVSKPELKVRKYTSKFLDRLNIKYHFNLHEIIGTPDITIETIDGHPIALFEDGCRFHGCLECFPIDEVNHEMWLWHSHIRHYDKMINEELTEQGYKVVRIWEHDVYNGNYKIIIKQIIAKIKST